MIFLSERKVMKIGILLKPNFCNEDQFLALGLLLLTYISHLYYKFYKILLVI